MKVNHIRQNVFPVLAALIWGTAFVAQSVAADHVGPFTFTAARSAVAFVFLLVLCLVFRCLRRRDFQEEAQARPGSWRDLAIGGICCGVVLTMGTNLQQMGLETTTSGKAGFITALYIVIVPIAGFSSGKRRPGRSGSVWRWRWWDCICCACRSPFPSRRGTGTCCCAPSASPDTSC
ncbi:DMT family transporter [Oscillibacter sp.]|uniref:DMT family transporter n=1 Tax=Oscillibacter sp. TaxID=1945593 RepID=UPI00338E5099